MLYECDVDILKILKNVDINKAHAHDNLSIRIIKYAVTQFRDCLKEGRFPSL